MHQSDFMPIAILATDSSVSFPTRIVFTMYEPTPSEFEDIASKVEDYVDMYADQEMQYNGHGMGVM